jgi:O-antigen ligase
VLLAAFVALVPFPYGAVTPGGTFALTGSAFVIGALAFLTRPAARRIGAAIVPVTVLAAIALAGLVQIVPMSMPRLQRIAPVSAMAYADANQILALFHRRPLTTRISIAPSDTESTILLTLAYAVLFCSGAILFSTRTRRRVALTIFFTSTVIHILTSTATTPAMERLHGTFINPNHFAGYLQIALAVAFGLIWREILHNQQRGEGAGDLADRVEKRLIPLVLSVLLWAVIAAGIALTRSRGAILAASLTTVAMIAVAPLHRRRIGSSLAAATIVLILGGILFVASTTGEASLLRFLSSDPHEIGSDARTEIWSASLRAFRQSPLLGSGLGTFREAFRRVQPQSVTGLVEQAHNDFLQMLVTGGWIGAALVTIAFASMFALLFRAWLRQVHREEVAFSLGGIGALLALVLHGLVEFNMSIPAIPATLAVILGLAWAAARHDPQHQSSRNNVRIVAAT